MQEVALQVIKAFQQAFYCLIALTAGTPSLQLQGDSLIMVKMLFDIRLINSLRSHSSVQ